MEKKLYILLIIIWKNFFITKIVNCFVSWTWTQLINVRLSLSEKKTRINSFVFFDNLFVVAVWKHSTRIVILNQTYCFYFIFIQKKPNERIYNSRPHSNNRNVNYFHCSIAGIIVLWVPKRMLQNFYPHSFVSYSFNVEDRCINSIIVCLAVFSDFSFFSKFSSVFFWYHIQVQSTLIF